MSDQTHPSTPIPIVDPYKLLHIIPNPDGTITRNFTFFPKIPAAPDFTPTSLVLTKDIPINHSYNTWFRLYLPTAALQASSPPNHKLPLIVYFHGGGFILCNADHSIFNYFCANMAADLHLIVASVDYRLAPEHRLPAAYDDAMESLHCIKTIQDDWLDGYADLSRCFLMGVSAGANIAYQVGLRAAEAVDDVSPIKIRGLILQHPFFGGVERTGSEMRLMNDPGLPPIVSDLMWDLSLPVGVDRDHEYSNPTKGGGGGGGSRGLDKMKKLGWKVLVTGCDGDPLIDRQMEVVKMMKEREVEAVGQFGVGDYHGVEVMEASKAKALYAVIKHLFFQ